MFIRLSLSFQSLLNKQKQILFQMENISEFSGINNRTVYNKKRNSMEMTE